MRTFVVGAALIGALSLSACQGIGGGESGPTGPQGVEGRWASVSGPVAYTATIRNGRFVSVEDGTGGVLASGTYSDLGPGQISILYTSTTRDQQIAANCNQVSTNRLSCATSSGSRFDLTRA